MYLSYKTHHYATTAREFCKYFIGSTTEGNTCCQDILDFFLNLILQVASYAEATDFDGVYCYIRERKSVDFRLANRLGMNVRDSG